MADLKISALTGATTPLAGTEVLPIVQSGTTVKVAVSDLTAGRAVSATQYTSTIAIGTAPFIVTSTTNVANLNASSLNGATFAAPGAIGSGTASTGAFTTVSASGAITSTLATGTAPLVIASTTNVANLNASSLNGATFAAPGAIGSGTASTIAGTTINSTGDVTIGAAAAGTNRTLNINGVVSKASRIAFQESGSDKWLVGNGAASENGVFQIYDATNGTGVQLARGGTSWTAISDEREKDIIEPITDAANKVASLRAVIGKYKTDESGMRRSFLIAQDVQAVLPEAVDDTDPDKLGVRYTELIPLLVAAITELQAEILKLKGV